jgi:hypothetical protein
MKKRLIISLAIALLLIATLALPAIAADNEESVQGNVSVGETISITLNDAIPNTGIYFGSVTANGSTYGDKDQSDGVPAIQVEVADETNVTVDIGIKGSTTDDLELSNWKYSTLFDQSDIASIPDTYSAVYFGAAAGSTNDFYHWITVPTNTPAGDYSATISYKAVKAGTAFP